MKTISWRKTEWIFVCQTRLWNVCVCYLSWVSNHPANWMQYLCENQRKKLHLFQWFWLHLKINFIFFLCGKVNGYKIGVNIVNESGTWATILQMLEYFESGKWKKFRPTKKKCIQNAIRYECAVFNAQINERLEKKKPSKPMIVG